MKVILFVVGTLIGGCGWILVPFQFGKVDIFLLVGYRFIISGALLSAIYFVLNRALPKFSSKDMMFLILQGVFMFSLNYWLSYSAVNYIPSGVVATILSLISVFNIIFSKLILRDKIPLKIIFSTLLGIIGVIILFFNDFIEFNYLNTVFVGFVLAFISVILGSLGTLFSVKGESNLLITLGSSMIAGGVLSVLYSLVFINNGVFYENTTVFWSSLILISLVVTPFSILIYLSLAKNYGMAFAGQMWVYMPVIAINLSAIFEDFSWDMSSIFAFILVLFSGLLATKGLKRKVNKV